MRHRLLVLVSPPFGGEDVRELQEGLKRLGYDPGRIDGRYGAATEAVVRAFQRHEGLPITGVVDEITFAAILTAAASPERPGKVPDRCAKRSAGRDALKWIAGHVEDEASRRLRDEITESFGIGSAPWGMQAVCLAFSSGAGIVLGDSSGAVGQRPGLGFTHVPSFLAWARFAGYWLGRDVEPLPGDIVVLNPGLGDPPERVGLVEDVFGAGTLGTLEGDVEDAVRRTRRSRYLTEGYVRILS